MSAAGRSCWRWSGSSRSWARSSWASAWGRSRSRPATRSRSSPTACSGSTSARPGPPATETIVWDLRLPRVLTAMIVGRGLAVAGATFQGLLRNPLADPYVLGTGVRGGARGGDRGAHPDPRSRSSQFGLLQGLAFVGALLATLAVYRLSRIGGLLADDEPPADRLRGRVAARRRAGDGDVPVRRGAAPDLRATCSAASTAPRGSGSPGPPRSSSSAASLILVRARALNGLLLGEEAAAHLGVDVRRERAILLGLASLVTAAAVAISGLIGFVGLVVPHVVRLLVGPNARLVLPAVGAVRRRRC